MAKTVKKQKLVKVAGAAQGRKQSLKPGSNQGSNQNSETLVLQAYIQLCYEIGVAAITLQKIADRAGVAFGTVRYYFSSEEKQIHEEAFALVLLHSYQLVESYFIELRGKAHFDPVLAYVETMFHWIRERPSEGSFLIYFYYLSSTQSELAVRANETVERARLRVEGLLHEAIGKGLYKPVNNSKQCAAMIHAITVGFGFIGLTFNDRAAFNEQKRICLESVAALVRADQRK